MTDKRFKELKKLWRGLGGESPRREKLEKNRPPEHHYGFSEGLSNVYSDLLGANYKDAEQS
jgi:hypothetical protein